MSDIIKEAFENTDPEADKRMKKLTDEMDFVKRAELALKSKGSVNFSKQVKSAADILDKSDI